MEKITFNLVMLTVVILSIMALWTIDISVGTMLSNGYLTMMNGFWTFNAMQMYHICLYSLIMLISLSGMLNIVLAHKKSVL